MQIRPILLIQAGDVAPVEVGEMGFGHGVALGSKPNQLDLFRLQAAFLREGYSLRVKD
jgi:hypothetical protein